MLHLAQLNQGKNVLSYHLRKKNGFTIVELIVVIAVIAILAAIMIVSYNAWQKSIHANQVKSQLNSAAQAMEGIRNFTNSYPATMPSTYTPSSDVTVTIALSIPTEFCLDGVSVKDSSIEFYVYSKQLDKGPVEGTCAERPDLDPPSAPVGISVAASTQTSISLTWDEVEGAVSYLAQCASDPAFIQSLQQVSVDDPDTDAVLTGFTVDTSLYCRVKAVNTLGGGGWSAIATGKTGTPPNAPVVAASTNSAAAAVFTWPAVAGAVSYTFQYSADGGSWVTGFSQQNTLTYTVTGYHDVIVDARVVAISSQGVSSSYGTSSITTPLWGTFTYQNGWSDYGGSYATGGFTKTSSGAIVLKGLLKRTGSVVLDETIAVLPPGYRPYTGIQSAHLHSFNVAITGHETATIKISKDGEIVASNSVNATATSLDRIVFMPNAGSGGFGGGNFTSLPLLNGWASRSQYFEPELGYKIDSLGRVFIQGSLDPGTTTSGTDIATLPTSSPDISVTPKLIVGMRAGCNGYTGINIGTELETRGNCLGTALFTQTMYYPDAAGASWTTMSLQNGWVVFNSTSNATPQYTKAADGIVTLKGLIKSGTTTNGVVLTNLPFGYRPSATITLASICDELPCRIDIQADGDVLGRSVSASWTSLSGLNFVAEQ
jgi:prepilin-type N-terminal cleavage/methylation domain-containing protein